MAILEIEPVKECAFPRVEFVRYVRERVERYSAFWAPLKSPIWSNARS